MTFQAIIFKKDKFTSEKARAWLKKNKHRPIKRVHKTKNYLRYRLVEPKKKYQYRTVPLGKHIKGILIIS